MVEGTRSIEPPAAQSYKQRIGAVELIALSDGGLNYPAAMIFGNVPPAWDYWMSADPSTVEAEALRHHLELFVNEARRAFNAIKDQVTLVQDGEGLLPGVWVEATYGHTPGHVMVSVSAGDQTVYNIGDVVVDPLFVQHPEWAPAIDMDAGRADETRRLFFAEAAEQNTLVFAHHLGPFPNLGRIVKKGDSWQWEPIETTG